MKLLPILFAFVFFGANAQEGVESTVPFYFGEWKGNSYAVPKGDKAYIFADACNVRKNPKADAPLVGKLLIGTAVKILERTDIPLTLNGVESIWLKIKSDTTIGYVWGGTLTNELLKLSNKRFAVWGITKYIETDTSRSTTISVRMVEDRKIISSVEFHPIYASNPKYGQLILYKKPLLDSVTAYLCFHTIIESCGASASNTYLLEVDGALKNVGTGYLSGEANYHESRELVFPISNEDPAFQYTYYTPQENHVFIVTINGYPDENNECLLREERTVEEFEWKNGELYKYCEE